MTEPVAAVQPAVPMFFWLKIMATGLASGIVALIGKMLWDYIKGGRVEKTPVYVTLHDCQHIRDNCGMANLKDRVADAHAELESFKAETRTRQAETEKRISESNYEIRAMRKDISEIKEASASSKTLLETLVKDIKLR